MYQPSLLGLDVEIPSRPSMDDDAVIDKASEKIVANVVKWLEQTDRCNVEIVKEGIGQILKDASRNYDGYALAKRLDDYGYMPDTELVEILDHTHRYVNEAHMKLIKEWVLENNIQPKHKIDDCVGFIHKTFKYDGQIYKIDNEIAQYCIYCKQLGHVKTGVGTMGVIINWEIIDEMNL